MEEFSSPFFVITKDIPISKLEQTARVKPMYFDSSTIIEEKKAKKRKGTEITKNVHISRLYMHPLSKLQLTDV